MPKTEINPMFFKTFSLIPKGIMNEIFSLLEMRKNSSAEICEIFVRREGKNEVNLSGERVELKARVGSEEIDLMIKNLIGGALYAHRDSIGQGYVSLPGGVRVGLSGRARYDGDSLVGVFEFCSFLFRFPTGRCAFGDELMTLFTSKARRGMLIYSPPGVGKTTALRHLAKSLGKKSPSPRIAFVDERCETDPSDFKGTSVDLLRGYKRRCGIEIATRTLSSDIIMIDELGANGAEEIKPLLNSGVTLVATCHASSLDDILRSPDRRGLVDMAVFDVFVGISRVLDKYTLKVDRI